MPTALEHVQDCAEILGRFDRRTTTGTGTTSTLVCADYINSVFAASEFANFAVLIESEACFGQQGMITNTGLAKASGTLTTADLFTDAIASGVIFSLYDAERLPALRKGTRPGLLQMANQALQRVWFEDTIPLTGVSDQIHYPVDTTTYPWFTDDTRIIEIQMPPNAVDDVPTVLPRERWSWVSDGETKKLRFPGAPFRTGQTPTIKVNRPGNSRLKLKASARAVISAGAVASIAVLLPGSYSATPTVGISGGGGTGATGTATLSGTGVASISVTNGGSGYTSAPNVSFGRNASDNGWSDQTTQTAGLRGMSDETLVDVTVLRPMMLSRAYAQLAVNGAPGQTVEEWLALSKQWEAVAVGKKQRRLPRDANDGVMRMRSAAVRGGGPYGMTY